jgi:large subunit ribosomal protein L18
MLDIKRRRRMGVTNYPKRIAMLKSGAARVVVRKSNRAVRMQIISYSVSGDKVLASASSGELESLGWKPRCNTPTAYLTGMLLANKAKSIKQDRLISDIGLYRPVKSSVVFAALKGCMDNGLNLLGKIEIDDERISGKLIKDYAQKLGGESNQFSGYKKEGFDISRIDETFESVKKKLKM